MTLNEECGFIQWVPNTIPIRPVLVKGYEARRIRSWVSCTAPYTVDIADVKRLSQTGEMGETFKKIKDAKDKEAADMFVQKILPMLAFLLFNKDSNIGTHMVPVSRQYFMTGLSKHSLNRRHGLQAVWHMEELRL